VDLPDGCAVSVKASCPTCQVVLPAPARLHGSGVLTVVTRDDPAFPTGLDPLDDTGLRRSYEAGVEVVPSVASLPELG
jgi:hypothetical protein